MRLCAVGSCKEWNMEPDADMLEEGTAVLLQVIDLE